MAKNNFDENFSVFDAPAEHKDKKQKSGKGKIIALIAGFLCVCLVVGGIFLVDKFMPETEPPKDEGAMEPFKVMETNPDSFTKVTVTSKDGTVELYSETKETETEEGEKQENKYWYIKGYEKIDVSSAISSLLSGTSDIEAYSEITKRSDKECGFENPRYTVSVETKDNKGFTLLVGDDSPDGFGMYLKFADSDKIYLVSDELLDNYIVDAENIMANIKSQTDA